MKKSVIISAVLLLSVLFSGCASSDKERGGGEAAISLDGRKAGETVVLSEKAFSDYRVRLEFTLDRNFKEGDDRIYGGGLIYLLDKDEKEIARSTIPTPLVSETCTTFILPEKIENTLQVLTLNENGEERNIIMFKHILDDETKTPMATFLWYDKDRDWFTFCDRIRDNTNKQANICERIAVFDDFSCDEGMTCVDKTLGYKITFDYLNYSATMTDYPEKV